MTGNVIRHNHFLNYTYGKSYDFSFMSEVLLKTSLPTAGREAAENFGSFVNPFLTLFLIILRTKNGYLGFKISMNLSSAV